MCTGVLCHEGKTGEAAMYRQRKAKFRAYRKRIDWGGNVRAELVEGRTCFLQLTLMGFHFFLLVPEHGERRDEKIQRCSRRTNAKIPEIQM